MTPSITPFRRALSFNFGAKFGASLIPMQVFGESVKDFRLGSLVVVWHRYNRQQQQVSRLLTIGLGEHKLLSL
ncbi:MAG: hypothetical protein ACRCU2_15210 [Planktothrix sp.]